MLAAAAAWILTGCSGPEKPTTSAAAAVAAPAPSVHITQFYTTTPRPAPGEQALICYGVENAKSAWLSPPRRELSPALARCIEVDPAGAATTYTLTAEGADGKTVSHDLTLGRGAPRVHIKVVDISAAEIHPGDLVNICYTIDNARTVTVDPIHFRAGRLRTGCFHDQPRATITYVVTATGEDGDTDQERVTIKVK
jgi:hypothetical protein